MNIRLATFVCVATTHGTHLQTRRPKERISCKADKLCYAKSASLLLSDCKLATLPRKYRETAKCRRMKSGGLYRDQWTIPIGKNRNRHHYSKKEKILVTIGRQKIPSFANFV